MPHCPLGLYDDILRDNFTKESIPKICLVGNTFQNYKDRMSDKEFQLRAPYIFHCWNHIHSIPFEASENLETMNAFSDLSLQFWTTTESDAFYNVAFDRQVDSECK